jgi:RHS repeat-associated protein
LIRTATASPFSTSDTNPNIAGRICDGGTHDGQACQYPGDCPGATCTTCPECSHSPFPLSTVHTVTTTSGLGGLTGDGHSLVQQYRFLAPYYDWVEREFRGFRVSVEENAQAVRRTETEFLQPGDHPADPLAEASLAAARPFKGKPVYGRTRSSGTTKVFAERTMSWATRAVADLRAGGVTTTAVALLEQTETVHGTADTTTITNRQEFAYDAVNNRTVEERYSVGGTLLISRRETDFAPEYVLAKWIVDRPDTIEVYGSAGEPLSRSQYDYDGNGNLETIQQWLDTDPIGTPGMITTTTVEYGGSPAGLAGQPTRIRDARGNPLDIAYTTVSPACDTHGLYPCTLTNALGHVTRRTYSRQFGRVTAETDANNAKTVYQYDGFGRLTDVFRPTAPGQDPTALIPWRHFLYVLGSEGSPAVPSSIKTELREPGNTLGRRIEVEFFDGLGRHLETMAEGRVAGASATIVRDAVGFDAAGRPTTRYAPFISASGPTVYDAPDSGDAATVSILDVLDRVTQVTKPDDSVREILYSPAGTTDIRDENFTACGGEIPDPLPPNTSCPGKRTVEVRDALGRLGQVSIYAGSSLDSVTYNQHDGLDRLRATQTGPAAATVSFEYDSLGRRIGLTEADSGTWQWGYDHAGNLLYQNDPRENRRLEFCYDALNRPTRKATWTNDNYSGQPCTSGTTLTTYTYDASAGCALGIGRLCNQSSPGRHSRTFTYDARGRALGETETITADGLQRTFTHGMTYDDADRVKTVLYPTQVDQSFETLTYGYNFVGQLEAAATAGNSYLDSATYDIFGRPLSVVMGDSSVHDTRSYFDAGDNFRLRTHVVTRTWEEQSQPQSQELQNWRYGPGNPAQDGYDQVGNPLQIADATAGYQGAERDNDWLYTYDGIGRLKTAQLRGGTATPNFEYDNTGNMEKGNLDFPAFPGAQVTFTHNPDRPHQVQCLGAGCTGTTFSYESDGANDDGNGGLTGRLGTVAGDPAKIIEYDEEGRIKRVTVGSTAVDSIYDDAGQRVARIVSENGTVTDRSFYFGRTVEVRNGTVIRHFHANGRRIAFSSIGAPPSLILAALPDSHPSVMLARLSRDAAWVEEIRAPASSLVAHAGTAGSVALLAGTVLLVLLPGRTRVGVLGRVRRGRVAALVLLYVVALPEWPRRPGESSRPRPVEAQCPAPVIPYPATLVHSDYLGSTTLLTAYKRLTSEMLPDGAPVEYYRYGPFGKMQAYKPNGDPVAPGSELTELTYTGQRWDHGARLYYYGARFYDPMIARFASIDPAREYMSPYAYVRWTPTRLVDPTGMVVGPELGGAAGLNYAGYFLNWAGVVPPKTFDLGNRPPEFEGLGGGLLGNTSEVGAHSDALLEAAVANDFAVHLANVSAYNAALKSASDLSNLAPTIASLFSGANGTTSTSCKRR